MVQWDRVQSRFKLQVPSELRCVPGHPIPLSPADGVACFTDDGDTDCATIGKDKIKFLEYVGKSVAKVSSKLALLPGDHFAAGVAQELALKVCLSYSRSVRHDYAFIDMNPAGNRPHESTGRSVSAEPCCCVLVWAMCYLFLSPQAR